MKILFWSLTGAFVAITAPAGAMIRIADAKAAAGEAAGPYAAQVSIKTDDDGRPWIAARFASDLKYIAEFYDCETSWTECEGISLSLAFVETGADVEDLNPWNQQRLSQAFIDADGDPELQFFALAPEAYGPTSLRVLLEFFSGQALLFHDFVYENNSDVIQVGDAHLRAAGDGEEENKATPDKAGRTLHLSEKNARLRDREP